MSAVSTSRTKKVDPLSKKIPENPKYKNVRPTVDTGASVTKYMEQYERDKADYKISKDEFFKRMKITTFVQLIVQVAEYDYVQTPLHDTNGSYRPDTADEEVWQIQKGPVERSPALSLPQTADDMGGPPAGTERSTLQRVIRGQGELDTTAVNSQLERKILEACPYLLLDIRDKDSYDQSHIVTAKNYPYTMLSRACNYETKDMLAYRNQPGKIILVYDECEDLAPKSVGTLVQRGYDNIFLLSGGMKVAYRIFPEGLITGTPPQKVTETPRPQGAPVTTACKDVFDKDDLNKIDMYLENALADKSTGSRLSKASTMSSRMSNYTVRSGSKGASQAAGRVSHQAPFK